MPLSEHEQRLLEQMERALYQEDPKFATSLRHGRSAEVNKRRIAIGAGAAVAGLALVLIGVSTTVAAVGVLGFAAMVGGAWLAFSAAQARPEAADANGAAGTGPTTASGSTKSRKKGEQSGSDFMGRMERRWRRRHEGDERP